MIVAVVNQKGGVGKSTIAVHLGTWLREIGIEAALVDADTQSSSSVWAREIEAETPIYRFQTSEDILERAGKLTEQVIVIDGPGGLDETTRAALLICDLALLPCGPSVLDLRAADNAVRALRTVQGIRNGTPKGIFVPNKVQKNYRLSKEMLSTATELGLDLAPALGLRQAFADAVGQETVVWRMGRQEQQAATEMINLFEGIFTIYNEGSDGRDEGETVNG